MRLCISVFVVILPLLVESSSTFQTEQGEFDDSALSHLRSSSHLSNLIGKTIQKEQISTDDWMDIGDAALAQREFNMSVRAYRTALRINTSSPIVGNLAVAELNAGNTDSARNFFVLEVLKRPTMDSFQNLASFYLSHDRFAEGVVIRQKALERYCRLSHHRDYLAKNNNNNNNQQVETSSSFYPIPPPSPLNITKYFHSSVINPPPLLSCSRAVKLSDIYDWWDVQQQTCAQRKWLLDLDILHSALSLDVVTRGNGDGLSPVQGMRMPISDELRRKGAINLADKVAEDMVFFSSVEKEEDNFDVVVVVDVAWGGEEGRINRKQVRLARSALEIAEMEKMKSGGGGGETSPETRVAVRTERRQRLKQIRKVLLELAVGDWSLLSMTSKASSRLHIGYFGFTFSPTRELNGLVTGIFSRHNRQRVKVTCFAAFGHHPKDSIEEQMRIENEVDEFVMFSSSPVSSPEENARAAALINSRKVHIMVDVIGLLPHNRNPVLAYQPAATQIVMVYAATTGSPWMQYFVSDRVTTTPELYPITHTEKLLYVPNSHFVNNQAEYLPVIDLDKENSGEEEESTTELPPTVEEFGLQDLPPGPLLGAFNAFHKMEPIGLKLWRRIVILLENQLLPSSILLTRYQYWQAAEPNMKQWWKDVAEELEQEMIETHFYQKQQQQQEEEEGSMPLDQQHQQEREILQSLLEATSSSLAFVNKTKSLREHVRRAMLADVFLDTRFYNAHTLAVDMLWAGVPIVTLPGTSLASRVSTSLLVGGGEGDPRLSRFVARSFEDYQELAVAVAKKRFQERIRGGKYGKWRTSASGDKSSLVMNPELSGMESAIFNQQRWVSNFERGLLLLWENNVAAGGESESADMHTIVLEGRVHGRGQEIPNEKQKKANGFKWN